MTATVGGYQLTDGERVEGLKTVETHQFNRGVRVEKVERSIDLNLQPAPQPER